MKNILFIGSESYDGPTITIIEGLYNLGYKIFVYKKSNINSWFCNSIIDSLNKSLAPNFLSIGKRVKVR